MRISDWSSGVWLFRSCITLRTISRSASGSCASNSLTADTAGLIAVLVMGGLLGDVEHHQPAMTASLLKRFCRTSRTLPDGMAAGSSSKEPARLADRADTGTHCRSAHGQMAAGHHLDGGGGRSRARDLWRDALFAASVRGVLPPRTDDGHLRSQGLRSGHRLSRTWAI